MPQLFGPTLEDQINCVRREITLRERVYRRRVSEKKMSIALADRELETMRAVLATLEGLQHG
jgi:hypothetical protein